MTVHETATTDVSQTSTETPADNTAATQTQTTSAESSPAPAAEKADATPAADTDKPLADVVRNVLTESRKKAADAKTAETASTPDANAKTDKPTDGKPASEPGKEPKEELPPFHKHPRWIDLNTKYKAATTELQTYRTQIAEIQPLADIGKSVQSFMAENHLNEDEFKYGQGIMSMMKLDPEAALEELDGLRERLAIHLGKVLPKDLNDRVESGEISEQAAKELLVARQKGGAAEAEAKQLKQKDATNTQQQVQSQIKSAIDVWWNDVKGRDPDVPKIVDMVNDRLAFVIQQHRAQQNAPAITPKLATQMVQQAYDHVKAKVKALVPPKPQVVPIRTETSKPAPAQVSTAPKTMLEVTRSVLAKSRGGGG